MRFEHSPQESPEAEELPAPEVEVSPEQQEIIERSQEKRANFFGEMGIKRAKDLLDRHGNKIPIAGDVFLAGFKAVMGKSLLKKEKVSPRERLEEAAICGAFAFSYILAAAGLYTEAGIARGIGYTVYVEQLASTPGLLQHIVEIAAEKKEQTAGFIKKSFNTVQMRSEDLRNKILEYKEIFTEDPNESFTYYG